MTQEFHLSITSLGSDRYLIRTEDTATGVPVAEAQVHWPVEEWLQLAQPAMDDPLLGLLQGQMDLGDRATALQKLGSKLHQALFQDDSIRESWLRAQGIAQNRHEILRLRLGLKESRLQRLPWEVMQQGGQPLTTRSNLTFVRYAANFLVGQTPEVQFVSDVDTAIRVLMVIASPHDQDHLKLLQEVKHIREWMSTESEASLPVVIDVLEQPDRSLLAQQLEQGRYQILHYAGHSDFGKQGGDLSLVNRQTGLTERLSGDDLAGLLVNNHVALTVFNSCRSGHTAGDDAEMDWRQQNLVQALVNRGVSSVVAMAERIPDEVAIAFTRLFYHNLRKGYPIDLSLSRTRQGLISAFGSDQHYWALPILYLQPDFDGYLTRRDREADDHLDPDVLDREDPLPLLAAEEPFSPPETAAPSGLTALEPVADSVPTSVLLTQLENFNSAEQDEEEALADFVKQLSTVSPPVDEPPMRASEEEVLVSHESQRAGMEIYDVLPEVPPQPETATRTQSTPLPQTAARGASAATLSAQPRFPGVHPPRQAERSLLIWFALGLVGVVGVIGLGLLAIRWSGGNPAVLSHRDPEVTETDLPAPADADPATFVRMGELAIDQGRYDDAREAFERALTEELMGATAANAMSDAIWSSVSDTQQPDLLYIQGRITWQEIARLAGDDPAYDTQYRQRTFAAQARDAWAKTNRTFLAGRVAQGFAEYSTGDLGAAIANWETALELHDREFRLRPDPAEPTPADPIILHAYAGLVMARSQAANINPVALSEDERLQGASPQEQAILQAEAENERAIAREHFLRLQELDPEGQLAPESLLAVNNSPETWNNWLWTPALLNDWRHYYRYWGIETADSP